MGAETMTPNSRVSPSRNNETVSRQSAFDRPRIDVGVTPAIRPECVSNRIRLSNEFAALMLSLIAERGAIDSCLRLAGSLVNAAVDKLSPNKKSVPCSCAENDFLAGAAEQDSLATVAVSICGVVFFIKRQARLIAVFRQPPQRFARKSMRQRLTRLPESRRE